MSVACSLHVRLLLPAWVAALALLVAGGCSPSAPKPALAAPANGPPVPTLGPDDALPGGVGAPAGISRDAPARPEPADSPVHPEDPPPRATRPR